MATTIVLTEAERMELNQRAASRNGRADDARRARLILLLEDGCTWKAILLLVAQPNRTLVRQDRARCHRTRGVHFIGRSAQKAHEIHPSLQQRAEDGEMALL